MPRSFWQFLAELGLAYPVAIVVSFPLGITVDDGIEQLFHPRHYSFIWFFLETPMLAEFWLTAALIAYLVSRRAAARPNGLLASSRAGEWVWLAGAGYILFAFYTYTGLSHNWLRAAVYELFISREDIGNIATAPFYMGIAYSLTRRLLRQRVERRTVSPESRAAN